MLNLAFIASPLDRNANNRANAAFLLARREAKNTRVLQIAGDTVRLENDRLFTENDAPHLNAIYLGEDDESVAWFARAIAPDESLKPLHALMLEGTLANTEISILAQARSLLHWHESHKFCARCGSKSIMVDAGYRRHCDACDADHFPRTDPVVIMAIRHGSKVLLGRQASWKPGMFSALAGFMEPGETIEAAVRRETLEEAGIIVGNVSYVQSQPWPFPSSLMIGMIGEAETTEIKIDPAELETARWFECKELKLMLAHKHPDGLYASHPYAIAYHILQAALKT
jgi:NAD+ diphosphatase